MLNDKEEAAYFYNDLLTFYDEENVRFLPSSFRRSGNFEDKDNDSILVRTEVLNALTAKEVGMVVTYTEAMAEKVVSNGMISCMNPDSFLSGEVSWMSILSRKNVRYE